MFIAKLLQDSKFQRLILLLDPYEKFQPQAISHATYCGLA
jgi:hypothetical protein